MKFFVVFAFLFVSVLATPSPSPYFIEPNFVNAETQEEYLKEREALATEAKVGDRIAGGTEAKKGTVPEFCFLSIGFYEKTKSCGCWVYNNQWVVTAARCVSDCSEGTATNITVTIPSLSGRDAVYRTQQIVIPTATNGLAALPDGFTASTLHTTIEINNVALIQLATAVPAAKYGTGKDVAGGVINLKTDADFATLNTRWGAGVRFKACGVGVIGNKGERAKTVTCTDVNIIADAANCKELYGGDAATVFTPGAGQLCIQWPDNDRNLCVGDYGGPIYAYKNDEKGNPIVASQEVICTAIGSPNVRVNAPCLDGHIVFCQFAPGPTGEEAVGVNAWTFNVANNIQPPPMGGN